MKSSFPPCDAAADNEIIRSPQCSSTQQTPHKTAYNRGRVIDKSTYCPNTAHRKDPFKTSSSKPFAKMGQPGVALILIRFKDETTASAGKYF